MTYVMPGEVLESERPGLFKLSLAQLLGAMLGYMLGALLTGENWIATGVCIAGGIWLTRRERGVYVWQDVYARLVWIGARGLYPLLYGAAADEQRLGLDPAVLYARERAAQGAETFIIKGPDGQMTSLSVGG